MSKKLQWLIFGLAVLLCLVATIDALADGVTIDPLAVKGGRWRETALNT